MPKEESVKPREVGIVPLSYDFVEILLGQMPTYHMEENVVIKGREMVAGYHRPVLQSGKIFFPRYAVDNKDVLFYEV